MGYFEVIFLEIGLIFRIGWELGRFKIDILIPAVT